ncbi:MULTISPECIES: hypothetical protein [Deinococcus]|uniref:Uncharacterized protein n=1 Tax=Deinococcus rufus TaxID=2136097 RepID=A0ABV7ZD43_9DEIO|nr:hypothetical protein [Deinococcus sp. AB2017081]WQE93566.1 hypothetical protein U2P90_09055 [Deinococcus sp. AB2017081]
MNKPQGQRIAYGERVLIFEIEDAYLVYVIPVLSVLIDEFILDSIFSKDFILDWIPVRFISAGRNIFIQEPSRENLTWREDITSTIRDYIGRREFHKSANVEITAFRYNQGIAVQNGLELGATMVFLRAHPGSEYSSGWKVVSAEVWNSPETLDGLSNDDYFTTNILEFVDTVGRYITQALSLPPQSVFAFRAGRESVLYLPENNRLKINLLI